MVDRKQYNDCKSEKNVEALDNNHTLSTNTKFSLVYAHNNAHIGHVQQHLLYDFGLQIDAHS